MSESKITNYSPGKHGPIRIDSKAEVDPKYLEREAFFTIDDDEEFTILKTPSPALGMEFLELIRVRGEAGATALMFDKIVEPSGGLRRLSRVRGLDPGTAEALMSVVAEKLMAVGGALAGN